MSKRCARLSTAWLMALGLLLHAAPLRAGDLADFNAAVAEAYQPYRSAISYLRTGNTDLAALEIESAQEHWSAVIKRFLKTPPDAFSGDKLWRSSLTGVGEGLDHAIEAVDAGDHDGARKLLAPIRGTLGKLRRRNNVTVFSDRIDEVSAAMERLWKYRHAPPDLAAPEIEREVGSRAAVFSYLLKRARFSAPPRVEKSGEFVRLINGALEGCDRLWLALERRDEALLINTLRELRSFERLLFLRFG